MLDIFQSAVIMVHIGLDTIDHRHIENISWQALI